MDDQMARWADGLSEPHLAIARSSARRIGVLAGPGTGKTGLGLMRRIARLLEAGVPGRRILLISFTRVAAADLREKVSQLQVDGIEAVRATTLHSYCLGLLRREAVLEITHREPRILMKHETDLMLRDVGGDFGTIYERRKLLRAFEAGWARATDDHPGSAVLPQDRVFENGVLGWLREHECMLIGEVVPIAYNYLRFNPLAQELQAYDHTIVDEYQDLNTIEQTLLDLLTERDDACLCVAGDDDQSIYSMRYANPRGIREFLRRAETEKHETAVCGRCPKRIVAMANSLIAHGSERQRSPLECSQEALGNVALVQWKDLNEEIGGTIAAVAKDVVQERREPGDILVLTQRRHIGERIREGLVERGIKAESYFAEEELDPDEAKEALALLRLAVSPDDAPALRVIIGIGDGTGRSGAYQRLRVFARDNGMTVRGVLDALVGGVKLKLVIPSLVDRYRRVVTILKRLDVQNLDDLVTRLFPPDIPAVAGLRRIAVRVLGESSSANELLAKIIAATTQDDVPQRPDFVRVMSLHKSKGLTASSVFVVGAIEGIVPMLDSKLLPGEIEAAIEEQRRLLYVAVTRAADQLTISYALRMEHATASSLGVTVSPGTIRRQRGGDLTCGTVGSRYLQELGSECPRPIAGERWIAGY